MKILLWGRSFFPLRLCKCKSEFKQMRTTVCSKRNEWVKTEEERERKNEKVQKTSKKKRIRFPYVCIIHKERSHMRIHLISLLKQYYCKIKKSIKTNLMNDTNQKDYPYIFIIRNCFVFLILRFNFLLFLDKKRFIKAEKKGIRWRMEDRKREKSMWMEKHKTNL